MKLPHIVLAILVSLCWGGNYVAAKISLSVIPPFLLLMLRFAVIAVLLLPFFPRPPLPWKRIALLSFMLCTLHFGLMFFAMWHGLSVSGTIVSGQLGVPFACLLGSIVYNDRLGRWRSLGMLVAFSGVVLIAGSPQIVAAFGAFTIACIASMSWGAANVWMKRMGQAPIIPLLCWMAVFAAPQFAVLSAIFEHGQMEAIRSAEWNHWLALAYTVIFSTLVAYGIWYWLLSRFPVTQVTPFNLLVPVFGLSIAQMFYAEPMTARFIGGTVLTLIGVGIIMFRRPKLGKEGVV